MQTKFKDTLRENMQKSAGPAAGPRPGALQRAPANRQGNSIPATRIRPMTTPSSVPSAPITPAPAPSSAPKQGGIIY
jgi:hypothetical protein